MKHWQYLPVQGLLYLISLMPFGVLYGIADFIFVLVYYVVRYRRKVVAKNMRDSFPDKNEKELRQIERQFYRNFADCILCDHRI